MGAQTEEVDASHSVALSQPAATAQIIRSAVEVTAAVNRLIHTSGHAPRPHLGAGRFRVREQGETMPAGMLSGSGQGEPLRREVEIEAITPSSTKAGESGADLLVIGPPGVGKETETTW